MNRGVILLAMTAVAFAQQVPTPQPEAWRMQAWKNALLGSHVNLLQMTTPPKACAVPLLPAPVDPHIGEQMPVSKPPSKNADVTPKAEGLPPCARE